MKYTGISALLPVLAGFILMAILSSGCAGTRAGGRAEPEQVDGIYEGSAQGYRGTIRVRVRMEAGTIMEITIVDSTEDGAVGGTAMEELADLVLLYNSTDIDAVSGATESSKGFLEAVENAILSL